MPCCMGWALPSRFCLSGWPESIEKLPEAKVADLIPRASRKAGGSAHVPGRCLLLLSNDMFNIVQLSN